MRPCLLHALRNPRGDGREVRSVSRARFLLKKKTGEWWASYFDALYLIEHSPLFDERRDRELVARLVNLMAVPVGSRILDCPCGQGRHARLFAEAGFQVDGVDLSRHLLKIARGAAKVPGLTYTRADMRSLPAEWSHSFQAVANLFSSFGFFLDPADDIRVVSEFSRALAPGGVLIWHGGNRDVIANRFAERDWWKANDGTLITQERTFDALSGVLTVQTSWRAKGKTVEREHRIRLYTATRLAELFAAHGMIVEQAFDGSRDRELSRASSTMLLVARKVP